MVALSTLATPPESPPVSKSWTFALSRQRDFKADSDLSLGRGDCGWGGLGGTVDVVIADRDDRRRVTMMSMQ
ncbi:hypothetical protein NJB1604_47440 [Mycobacterium marinum]|uniref:hypothetical protein n=1 Tax=Mycobacterium marinum TaxID=1781 RepID=UPI000E3B6ED7|nr:hypothetical protein [Mycobacterium marinum]GJO55993.1 hypothetical protein NJB1604_47440 [Mycobacterium marinum]